MKDYVPIILIAPAILILSVIASALGRIPIVGEFAGLILPIAFAGSIFIAVNGENVALKCFGIFSSLVGFWSTNGSNYPFYLAKCGDQCVGTGAYFLKSATWNYVGRFSNDEYVKLAAKKLFVENDDDLATILINFIPKIFENMAADHLNVGVAYFTNYSIEAVVLALVGGFSLAALSTWLK